MGLFGTKVDRTQEIVRLEIAQIGHWLENDGGPKQTGIRFFGEMDTIHIVWHRDLTSLSQMEIRMLERGDVCDVTRSLLPKSKDAESHWAITGITTVHVRPRHPEPL